MKSAAIGFRNRNGRFIISKSFTIKSNHSDESTVSHYTVAQLHLFAARMARTQCISGRLIFQLQSMRSVQQISILFSLLLLSLSRSLNLIYFLECGRAPVAISRWRGRCFARALLPSSVLPNVRSTRNNKWIIIIFTERHATHQPPDSLLLSTADAFKYRTLTAHTHTKEVHCLR